MDNEDGLKEKPDTPRFSGLRDPHTPFEIHAIGEFAIPRFPGGAIPSQEGRVGRFLDDLKNADCRISLNNMSVCIGNERQLKESCPEFKSVLVFDLPYRLSGFDTTSTYASGIEVTFKSTARESTVSAANLGLVPVGNIDRISLEPDDLGLCGKTTVTAIWNQRKRPDLDNRVALLEEVLECVNAIIDWYCLAHEDFGKRRIAPTDIAIARFGHVLEDDPIIRNLHTFYLPLNSRLSFHGPETAHDERIIESIKCKFALSEGYRFAYHYWVDAKRALHHSDARFAAIQATICLEIAVFQFLRDRFANGRPSKVTIREGKPGKETPVEINLESIRGKSVRSMGLPRAFGKVFPEVMKAIGEAMPSDEILIGCKELQKERNLAVHDPNEFQKSVVIEHIDRIVDFVDFLVAVNGKSAGK